MSSTLTRTYSLRKTVRPIYDIDEEDDNQRRDSSGRKRVDVVQCLLESSTDENDDDINVNIEATSRILWLKFDEICHIRFVLSRTSLCLDNQCSQILRGELCFRCRRRINESIFFLSFLPFNNYEICFICKHLICPQCAYSKFQLPASKLSIPIRIQTLIKPPSVPIENRKENTKTSNTQTKTICYDCLQIFKEHITTSDITTAHPPTSPLRRTASLPPMSSQKPNEVRRTRHRRRRPPPPPIQNQQ